MWFSLVSIGGSPWQAPSRRSPVTPAAGDWLSNSVSHTYDDIVAQCCGAWNKLTDQPWRVMSIGTRDWAHPY